MSATVKVYDHDATPELSETMLISCLKDLAAPVVLKGADKNNLVDELKAIQVVIIHTGDEDFWRKLLNESVPESIRIRTSTAGRYQCPNRISNKGVIELNLKPNHTELNADDWKLIITEVKKPEVARAIAVGKIPANLNKYFWGSFPEILTALSILCQGYLAVMKPIELGLQQGVFIDDVALGKAKKEVSLPEWWLRVFIPRGQSKPKLTHGDFKIEWPEPSDVEEKKKWKLVDEFIGKLLGAKKGIAFDDFSDSVVNISSALKYRLSSKDTSKRG